MKDAAAETSNPKVRRNCLIWIAIFSALSLTWGIFLTRTVPGGVLDFQGVYYGTSCLLEHCDPYNVSELEGYYHNHGLDDPTANLQRQQVRTLYVNMPTTFLVVAPFTLLQWSVARAIWMTLIAVSFILAAVLMWDIGAKYSPGIAAMLVCIVMANSEVVFGTGNTAGLVVSLCIIAVWCFLQGRHAAIGVACLVAALIMKPHDAGLVWLYFLLIGGVYRKRAIQTFAITAVLGVAALLWVSHSVPNWLPEMRTNLAVISGPGGLNEPGPTSVTSHTASMVVDLQAAVSVLRDDPKIYNLVTYLVCGSLFGIWSVKTLRSRFSKEGAWIALAVVVPLTMLVTYHRPYDTKLLLLAVPACSLLWAEGGRIGRIAALITTAAVTLTGDIALAALVVIYRDLAPHVSGFAQRILALVFTRPASLILLAATIFYLCVYVRQRSSTEPSAAQNPG